MFDFKNLKNLFDFKITTNKENSNNGNIKAKGDVNQNITNIISNDASSSLARELQIYTAGLNIFEHLPAHWYAEKFNKENNTSFSDKEIEKALNELVVDGFLSKSFDSFDKDFTKPEYTSGEIVLNTYKPTSNV